MLKQLQLIKDIISGVRYANPRLPDENYHMQAGTVVNVVSDEGDDCSYYIVEALDGSLITSVWYDEVIALIG